jgi:hypothetical protein
LPKAVGLTAIITERLPLYYTNSEIAEVLGRATLFPREMVDIIDFKAELKRFFYKMLGELLYWSIINPLPNSKVFN